MVQKGMGCVSNDLQPRTAANMESSPQGCIKTKGNVLKRKVLGSFSDSCV